MTQKLSIEYLPVLSHGVVQSAVVFLGGLTILDLMLTLTNWVRYNTGSPVEFHLAPALLILICAIKITLQEVGHGQFDYRMSIFGVPVLKKRFVEVCRATRGKFVTLIGMTKNGASRTFITSTPVKAEEIFSRFPSTV